MKLFVFPFSVEDLACFTEVFSVIPLLSEKHYKCVLDAANSWNEGLYTRLRFLTPTFDYVQSLDECDLAVIPFKYNKDDARVHAYCKQASASNKKVVSFFNDDTGEVFNLPKNLFLFRTSVTNKLKQENERSLPVVVPDHFPCHIPLSDVLDNKVVTFCGHIGNGRLPIIERFRKLYGNTNIVYRNGFWAPEVTSKQKARQTFYNNLLSGSFSLCIRGNGNFSYRFYEALSFGRVPILIDTDCVLPFSNEIDWSKHILKIDETQMDMLPELIQGCNLSPWSNRKLWQTFFSAEGYYTNFIKEI